MSISRREFLGTGATAAAGLTLPRFAAAESGLLASAGKLIAPTPVARPCVIASGNGLKGVAKAYEKIGKGEDVLDAIIGGVNLLEVDPEEQGVGLGGLPNEEGVVQLDASCMHGPTKRAGSVACLEGIATPSLVAKAIMDYTNHIMLVGHDAKRFALSMGFKEQDLLTDKSRQDWLRWKSRQNPNDNWLDHDDDVKIKFYPGTVNMCAVNAAGDLSSVTSTSGLSWKIPGRVGDSPIIGAGQYCDNTVGAAGGTGRGESNMKICGAFLTIEYMRAGLSPQKACLKTLERAVAMTEPRLLDEKKRPKFQLIYYAVAKDGTYGGAALFPGSQLAVADDKGARLEDCASLFK
jgi:N4-(beta-N-acetylglucosaminyl)-L-asparaginase